MIERILEVALELTLKAVADPDFYVGVAAFIAAVAIPFLSQTRGKLYFDVVCAVEMFDEERENLAVEVEKPGTFSYHPKRLTLIIIDLQNTVGRFLGGLGGQDIDTGQYIPL